MRRAITIILAAAMLLSMCACGGGETNTPAEEQAAETAEETATESTPEPTAEPTPEPTAEPTPEPTLDPIDRVTLDAGPDHFIAIKEDGAVIAGLDEEDDDDFGQCDVGDWTDIVSVAGGGSFSLGLKSDGTVVMAGGGSSSEKYDVSGWTDIVDIAAGYMHAVGLRSDGTVVATGYNDNNQCNVEGWTDIVDVAAGAWHTIGLRSDGTVVAVGENDDGECNVSGWTDIVAIDGNCWCTVGLKADGTVVYAGGDEDDQNDLAVMKRWSNVVALRAFGSYNVFGITADGRVLETHERSNVSEGAAYAVVCDGDYRYDTLLILMKDGTVQGRNNVFDGVKLQMPTVHRTAEQPSEAPEETDMGPWVLKAYVDEFNLPTDEYYIVNDTSFSGTFSNSATTNSELGAYIFYEPYETSDYISIRLFEYGNMRVKNPYSHSRDYDIVMMDNDGNKRYLSGTMYSQDSDIDVSSSDSQVILDALKKGGTVRFAITEKEDSLTKYIITIEDATGFEAAYRAYWSK